MCKAGAINGYACDACGQLTIIRHVDEGVTPMFLACRAEGLDPREATCKGQAVSLMYPPGDPPSPPTWEWYKPSPEALKRMKRKDPAMYEHIRKGGLELRKIVDPAAPA